jgi:Flp pilus assembly protein TadD
VLSRDARSVPISVIAMARKRKNPKTKPRSGQTADPSSETSIASPPNAKLRRFRTRTLLLPTALIAAALVVSVTILRVRQRPDVSHSAPHIATAVPAANFVGAAACGGCHERELKLWSGSHHQLAMQRATDSTILGDFNNASLAHSDVTSRFFRRGYRFMVLTDGPDGALHDYEIKYTFGVYPLQQYLIELPGARLQAFGIAWDSRSRENGGQRWFDLHPDRKLRAGDPLHWTGLDQNWNFMCADCHSTNVRKNYHFGTRTYSTAYAEIDVACEACHGPGSHHVAWVARSGDWRRYEANRGLPVTLDERRGVNWKIDRITGNALRSTPRHSEREIEMCARCHSRRSQIHEDYVHSQPVDDDYRVSLLDENLYYPDGQIKDEVYEYGSFIQSRMFHAGVTCSDCHEPHSLKLRAEGSGVCLQCHAAQKYNSARHHFHNVGTAGSQCVECHMPTRTYMVVDARRDHSMRIPRPELTVELGVPNACNGCHRDRTAAWAAQLVAKWHGHEPAGFQQFAKTLYAGSIGAPGSQELLAKLAADRQQPAIARASALALMAVAPGSVTAEPIRDSVHDTSPMVRRGAARVLSGAASQASAGTVVPLLNDRVRAVRIEAAEALAGAPADALPKGASAALEKAISEYVAAQQLNADRPEAHSNLALLFAREKRFGEAKAELNSALSLDPSFTPAAVDLADLDRELGSETEGEHILRDAIARSPDDASLQHALGLLLVRQGRRQEALDRLAAAARLDPSNARFVYVYAVALNDAGQTDRALMTLEDDLKRHPYDRDALAAMTDFYRSAAKPRQAIIYARRLAALVPNDAQVQQQLMQLNDEVRP